MSGGRQNDKAPSDSSKSEYQECEETYNSPQPFSMDTISSFLGNETFQSSMFLISILMILHRRTAFTRSLFLIFFSLFVIKQLSREGDFTEYGLIDYVKVCFSLHKQEEERQADQRQSEQNSYEDIDMDEIVPQGPDEDISIYTNLITVLINGVVGYKAKGKLTESLLAITKSTDTQYKNVSLSVIWISSKLHDFFHNTMQMENVAEYFYVNVISDLKVKDFLDRVSRFISIMNAGSPSSHAYCTEVYETYTKEGSIIVKGLDRSTYEYRAVMNACTKLTNLKQVMDNIRTSLSGDRIEPVGVLIRGVPGCFKSILMSRIGNVVAKHTIPLEWKEDFNSAPKDFHYSIPNDKFFDGYTNKAWVSYVDDIFQKRDSVGDENSDALKIIKMINSAPYVLPMAEASSKNNMFFRSAFVLATTNLPRWSMIESIIDVKAVQRRFNVELTVKIADKYLDPETGMLDYSLLPNLPIDIGDFHIDDSTTIPNDFWHITMISKKANKPDQESVVSVLDVIKLIITEHHERIKQFYVNKTFNATLADQLSTQLDFEFQSSSIFSKLCATTLVPQGLANEDIFDSQQAGLDYEFYHYLDHLDHEDYMVYDDLFYSMCKELGRNDLYIIGFKIFIRKFLSFPINNVVITAENYHTPRDLFLKLYHLINLRIIDNRDVYSSDKDYSLIDQAKDILGDCLNRCHRFVINISKFIKKNLHYLLLGGVIIGPILYWASGFFRSIITPMSQSIDTSRLGKRVGVKHTINLADQRHHIIVRPQGFILHNVTFDNIPNLTWSDFGSRTNTNDIISSVFNKYFFIIYLITPDKDDPTKFKTERLGHGLNIKGQLFLIPFHFIYQLHRVSMKSDYKGAHIVLTNTTQSNRYNLTLEDFILGFKTTADAANKDTCIVEIKVAQKMSAGLIRFVMKDSDVLQIKRVTNYPATIAGSYQIEFGKPNLSLRSVKTRAKYNNTAIVINATWDDENPHYKLFDTISYRGDFGPGDCGSLLMCTESNFENRIINGIHVAGDPTNGYGTTFTQESLNALIDESFGPIECFLEEEEPDYFVASTEIVSQSGLNRIGILTPKYTPSEIHKSDIKKSVLYGCLPYPYNKVGTLPSRLKKFTKDGIEINPMRLALNKYGKLPSTIPMKFIDGAVKSYSNLIHMYSPFLPGGKRIIDTKESLHCFDNVNSIASSTSAGFPMTIKTANEDNLKKEYFDAIRDNDLEKQESVYLRIAKLVDECILKYNENVRPYWLYKDSLKDETIDYKKALIGKTRMFSGSPFILLVLFRKYFGSFINMYTNSNIDVGSAIGINPYGKAWDSLARNLSMFDANPDAIDKGAGDFSGYDTTEFASILNRILDIINDWYGFENKDENHIRSCLWAEITNSRHVAEGNVYEWFSGMPSGNPMTAIINTMYNNLVFRIAYQFANLDVDDFNCTVYLCCLGDDNIFSTHPGISSIFNEMTLPDLMRQCGMKYTTELKGTATVPARKLSNVEFLKRSFVLDRSLNRWVAPLREEAIINMLNWTKKGLCDDQITVDNMVFALREFSLHGIYKFNYWKTVLLNLKTMYLPNINPHSEFEVDFDNAYSNVLKEEYYF